MGKIPLVPLLTLWSVVFVAMFSDIYWRHCLQLVVLLLHH